MLPPLAAHEAFHLIVDKIFADSERLAFAFASASSLLPASSAGGGGPGKRGPVNGGHSDERLSRRAYWRARKLMAPNERADYAFAGHTSVAASAV